MARKYLEDYVERQPDAMLHEMQTVLWEMYGVDVSAKGNGMQYTIQDGGRTNNNNHEAVYK